ncbi:hypothetical protein P5G50_04760 [Leifsonia sp. F6_8S_P_1B]|uniref:Helix-turn-helix domain-containing protein n=1 Tax=Leifsonia williamsii TaxID=3035919 RepID=A0ABT8K8I0_9MICO|nr:hypothetical protein [Leifsonia williamsii]MDN4613758.1 hypothetical protein [Leifsonia williamsii]
MAEATVAEIAHRLGVSDRRVRMLLEDGAITGRKLSSGDWLADNDSVIRWQHRRKASGRNLDQVTAWAILYELSGVRAANLLSRSTFARARTKIRLSNAADLALSVAARTTAHRFRAANAVKAQADLIPTGRAASDLIGSDLLADTRRVAGYVPAGTTVAEYARTHFMVEDPTGADVLYENTAPGDGYTEPLPAVVAADLALSTDTRERSAGLDALEEMKGAWLLSRTS